MFEAESWLGLPGLEITESRRLGRVVWVRVRGLGEVVCPRCASSHLRLKDRRIRLVRHEVGSRSFHLELETDKWLCKECGRYFWRRFPGIPLRGRSSDPFRSQVARLHEDGISRKRLSERLHVSPATVERWFLQVLRKRSKEQSQFCPRILGIDEHFFTKKKGFATTFCDLGHRKVYDVVLGRSEASLEPYLSRLKGKEQVQMVAMDLSTTYRAVVRKHFPNAKIVADRFHVIRLINHHFLRCWKEIDPTGAQNRGLLSLMRRHRHRLRDQEQAQRLKAYLDRFPVLDQIYRLKQKLCYLLLKKHKTKEQCKSLIPRFLRIVQQLKECKLRPLVTLGETLSDWQEEIVTMWRFTKNNAITEGFHNKMETLTRQAYGFRNFENYRLRVKVLCG